ncbi:hypothetical protein [Corynebacterium glyciniphilum]|uniref:hypothetical protein n=1 Tax=Corynebacterium glyciniphilum TaxID=1404244 RepID=UPI001642A334|nr:hypothetical protein [Corynebacterium glyciniphilum]
MLAQKNPGAANSGVKEEVCGDSFDIERTTLNVRSGSHAALNRPAIPVAPAGEVTVKTFPTPTVENPNACAVRPCIQCGSFPQVRVRFTGLSPTGVTSSKAAADWTAYWAQIDAYWAAGRGLRAQIGGGRRG